MFLTKEKAAVYMCLAAVLFLSNIEFLESSVGGVGERPDSFTDGVIIDDEYPLQTGTKLVLILREYNIYLQTSKNCVNENCTCENESISCSAEYIECNIIWSNLTKKLNWCFFTVAVAEILDIDEEALTKALQSNTHNVNGKINCFYLFRNLQ